MRVIALQAMYRRRVEPTTLLAVFMNYDGTGKKWKEVTVLSRKQ